jgi:tripartite-type tricarboxylate transporter receptor subunit TctC
MRVLFLILAALVAGAPFPPVQAETYPDRPVKIIHGFAPGGGADVVARLIAGELAKTMGQPFVVEPRPGAGSTIAADAVAKSPPNGYTLYEALATHAISGALYKKLPYDPVDSFAMISTIYEFPMVIAVRADSPYHTLQAALAAAKTKPDAVAFGSSGIGTPTHLIGELLSKQANVQLLHVPYKGEVPVVQGLLGGEIPLGFVSPNGVIEHIKAGKIKAIAVTSNTRWKGLPDVPTVEEAGIAGFDVRSWLGLAAPVGTPKPIIEQLNAEIQKALQVPDVRAKLEQLGGDPKGSTPEQMRALVARDLDRWKKVVADSKIPQQ